MCPDNSVYHTDHWMKVHQATSYIYNTRKSVHQEHVQKLEYEAFSTVEWTKVCLLVFLFCDFSLVSWVTNMPTHAGWKYWYVWWRDLHVGLLLQWPAKIMLAETGWKDYKLTANHNPVLYNWQISYQLLLAKTGGVWDWKELRDNGVTSWNNKVCCTHSLQLEARLNWHSPE